MVFCFSLIKKNFLGHCPLVLFIFTCRDGHTRQTTVTTIWQLCKAKKFVASYITEVLCIETPFWLQGANVFRINTRCTLLLMLEKMSQAQIWSLCLYVHFHSYSTTTQEKTLSIKIKRCLEIQIKIADQSSSKPR